MLGALLLILIGTADIARAGVNSTAIRIVMVAIAWFVAIASAIVGLGIPVWWIGIPVLLAAAWLATTTTSIDRRTSPGILPAIGIVAALLVFLVWDDTAVNASGFIVDWHSNAASAVVSAVPLPAIAVSLGVVLFVIESSNLIVRATLRPATAATRPAIVPATRASWWRRTTVPSLTVVDLRGGRLIGPLERVLIIGLTLAGAAPIVAGLIAAKGIVRFPEISNDGASGSKAEYFLVGSLVSWAIAVAAAALIWLSAVS